MDDRGARGGRGREAGVSGGRGEGEPSTGVLGASRRSDLGVEAPFKNPATKRCRNEQCELKNKA